MKEKVKEKENEKKIVDFHFPITELTTDDYLPVDLLVLKTYYKNTFLQLMDKVSKILYLLKIINIR